MECVPIEDQPAPVDGGWGDWSGWSKCTRDCGGGITMLSRQCDNPKPANGGSFCVGERVRYQVCNENVPCPGDAASFREQQCSAFNRKPFEGKYYKWIPYTTSGEKIELCAVFV